MSQRDADRYQRDTAAGEALFLLGEAAINRGDLPTANRLFQRALHNDEDDMRSWLAASRMARPIDVLQPTNQRRASTIPSR